MSSLRVKDAALLFKFNGYGRERERCGEIQQEKKQQEEDETPRRATMPHRRVLSVMGPKRTQICILITKKLSKSILPVTFIQLSLEAMNTSFVRWNIQIIFNFASSTVIKKTSKRERASESSQKNQKADRSMQILWFSKDSIFIAQLFSFIYFHNFFGPVLSLFRCFLVDFFWLSHTARGRGGEGGRKDDGPAVDNEWISHFSQRWER